MALLIGGETIVIGIDETLERRWGKRIWGLGSYRDGVKSSHHTVKSSGVRWQVMPSRYPGHPRTQGVRLPSLQQHLDTLGFASGPFHKLRWDGGTHALRPFVTGPAVWAVEGDPPLPCRWVRVIASTKAHPPTALCSTGLLLTASEMVELHGSRWSLEVTLEAARAHLGVQSQRPWSQAATTRTTPVLLALFSLICWRASRRHAIEPRTPRTTAW